MIRYFIVLGMLLATATTHRAIVAAQARAAESTADPTALSVPSEILNFRQARPDIPVDESIRQQLETNTILMRDYVSSFGLPVHLTIVYAENTRRSLHFPEVCLTGQGWEVSRAFPIPVGVFFVGKGLVLQKGDAREAVIYWFQTGRHCTGNYFVNSFRWAWDKLLLRSPGNMLVRLSAPIGPLSEEAAFGLLNDFAFGLAPILIETTP